MLDLNEQCPSRGPALKHVRDTRKFADGRCVYCGAGAQVRKFVCAGYGCISWAMAEVGNTSKVYCGNCARIRAETEASHNLEGHSEQAILMCPPCEGVAA